MKTIRIMEEDCNNVTKTFQREAVRAIIIKDNKIAMISDGNEQFYQLPGGGIEGNETHCDTLCREIAEETGLHIKTETIEPYGKIIEHRLSIFDNKEIFHQTSYYYFAEVTNEIDLPHLVGYEKELNYHLIFIDIKTAYEANRKAKFNKRYSYINRDGYILELLLSRRGK